MTTEPSQGELSAVVEFLAVTSPFDLLSNEQLKTICSQVTAFYRCQGQPLGRTEAQIEKGDLLILRAGALDIWSPKGELIDRLGEGDNILMSPTTEKVEIRIVEDSLIFKLPASSVSFLRGQSTALDQFLQCQLSQRSLKAEQPVDEPTDMLRKLDSIMSTRLTCVDEETNIQAAAQLMSEQRVSSILINNGKHLTGIVTDRDIRSKVVAEGIDLQLPISTIMTPSPINMESSKTLLDATLLMSRTNIHHLPIVDDASSDKPIAIGMVTVTDLLLARENDPVMLAQRLSRQKSVEGLEKAVKGLSNLVVQWQQTGIRATHVSYLLTSISEAITCRLIELAIEELGEPPVPFCWLGFGSQGRGEQLLGADQDNGLVISDELTPEQEPWFEKLSVMVCNGLAQCGYILCPGDIMAMNPLWRLPLKSWCKTVSGWANTPTPDAVMRVSIFFDIKAIYGDEILAKQLQTHMLSVVSGNQRFLAALTENVLKETPPIGLFRRFAVETNGEHAHELNLKKRGLLQIIEIARVRALANGISAVNTTERLKALITQKQLTQEDGQNLLDALKVITQLRLQNQANQFKQGEEVDNYLDPDHLSSLQRRQLKDAFSIVADAQRAVKTAYMPSM